MTHEQFQNKTNSTLNDLSESKMVFVFTLVIVFTLLEKLDIHWLNGHEVKFDLEGQDQSPQNNRDLNQGVLHLWSKFGDCNFDELSCGQARYWHMHKTVWHTHTDMTDTSNDNTQRPHVKNMWTKQWAGH